MALDLSSVVVLPHSDAGTADSSGDLLTFPELAEEVWVCLEDTVDGLVESGGTAVGSRKGAKLVGGGWQRVFSRGPGARVKSCTIKSAGASKTYSVWAR
jgi:hypothetical protein